jgi:hypothetical protein
MKDYGSTGPRWSGTENRHRQGFQSVGLDHEAVECVSLKCKGAMKLIRGGTHMQCDTCDLIIKRPAAQR